VTKVLAEIEAEEREGVKALIIRTTEWRPWHVWLVIPVPTDVEPYRRHDEHHLLEFTYGHRAFEPVRGLQRFYVDDITFFKARYGSTFKRSSAERRARRKLERFLRWRARQQRVEQELVTP
jgi:hypothetical protein